MVSICHYSFGISDFIITIIYIFIYFTYNRLWQYMSHIKVKISLHKNLNY